MKATSNDARAELRTLLAIAATLSKAEISRVCSIVESDAELNHGTGLVPLYIIVAREARKLDSTDTAEAKEQAAELRRRFAPLFSSDPQAQLSPDCFNPAGTPSVVQSLLRALAPILSR